MPIEAQQLVRKMRGGAQAHLVSASDGQSWVVKFANNPQHRRILINEWISSVILDYLDLAAPPAALIEVTESFLEQEPEVGMMLGRKRVRPETGAHFGSRYPGPPARTVVYDFLPDPLLNSISNLPDFIGTLAFDKWLGNADSRQAIFFRARLAAAGAPQHEEKPRLGIAAQMIDNGYVFEGPHWRFADSPIQGLYFRPQVYGNVHGWDAFEPWLERIRHFPEEVLDQAVKRIPPRWFEQTTAAGSGSGGAASPAAEQDALEALLEQLLRRRSRVADLIEQARDSSKQPFPNWQ